MRFGMSIAKKLQINAKCVNVRTSLCSKQSFSFQKPHCHPIVLMPVLSQWRYFPSTYIYTERSQVNL